MSVLMSSFPITDPLTFQKSARLCRGAGRVAAAAAAGVLETTEAGAGTASSMIALIMLFCLAWSSI